MSGGKGSCSGRLEVYHNATWGSVCDDKWNIRNAQVVCRQLGCGSALSADRNVSFGPGEETIWLNRVKCRGDEIHLWDCHHSLKKHTDCSHVGVTCAEHWSLRLSGGKGSCSGRLEVYHNATWGSVCDDQWNIRNAQVVCRQLGCGSALSADRNVPFGPGEGTIWLNRVKCRGDEIHLWDCHHSLKKHADCSHAGVTCAVRAAPNPTSPGAPSTPPLVLVVLGMLLFLALVLLLVLFYQNRVLRRGHTEARLVNGSDSCSGRVELQYLGEWGTVCAVGWDMRAADVLCAQLDCGSAVAVVEVDWFGEGSRHIWADVFDCQGNETHLSQCGISSWSRAACYHKNDAGVICNGSSMAFHEGQVRLSGGSECQGEVEIYFRQDWRRVLLDSWSLSEASVLCRQLGCGSVLNYRSSPSTTEHKHMCVTGFSCSGSEAHLGNCSSAQPVNCSSGEQLYITCSVLRSIRLVGSGGDCAGRLEVFHSGSWGTVCDDSWDIEDAQVVCRQLQCGEVLSTHIPAWFGPGTGSIWLNEVECEGNETSLWNCRFQLSEEGECGHHEDVGVVCSGTV
ncbi:hypothetical protein PGIGA_G00088650 [Pangasianodon gigas]|uniref:Uncharacterized protein n=1 Tax=Pangasianodon gigas TaxID=30993 RepID=A0ACC5XBY6_PANGG|nr:hypothetical protein [Pangasianodon gigas]